MTSLLKKPVRFVARLWAYLPIIWNDVDYDYGSILQLIRFKLQRMQKFIAKHGIHLRKDSDVRRMWIAEMLLTRIIENNYGLVEHEQLCDKWGELVFVKGIDGTRLVHAKETSENAAEVAADLKRVVDATVAQEEADWHALWKYFDKYMRSWWD